MPFLQDRCGQGPDDSCCNKLVQRNMILGHTGRQTLAYFKLTKLTGPKAPLFVLFLSHWKRFSIKHWGSSLFGARTDSWTLGNTPSTHILASPATGPEFPQGWVFLPIDSSLEASCLTTPNQNFSTGSYSISESHQLSHLRISLWCSRLFTEDLWTD